MRADYLETLINLGSVLGGQGRWAEAKATYRLAVQIHPNSGVAFNALGRLLSRLTEDDEEAERCLRQAIALKAYDNNTYVELGNILMRKLQTDAARSAGAQDLQPLITRRANQEKADFSTVFLDTPLVGSTQVTYLADRASYGRHFHCVIPGTTVDIGLLRAKADVVFNMICNGDDGKDILPHALELIERLGRPTINHPRLIMNTDRATIAFRQHVSFRRQFGSPTPSSQRRRRRGILRDSAYRSSSVSSAPTAATISTKWRTGIISLL